MIKATILNSIHELPLLMEPNRNEISNIDAFLSWYRGNKDSVEKKLLNYGAILFRGFAVNTPRAFARFVREVSGDLLDYVDGNAPRTKLTDGIYTSTEYPAEYFISLHNELSYSYKWPSKLFFCCIAAPREGGETPIADSRAILKSLSPTIVEVFTRKQVKYSRNLHSGDGFGPSWTQTFETTDRSVVEEYCQKGAIDWKWKDGGGLRICQIRPAVATHPLTGEQVWFNQADQFHPSTLPKEEYESMMLLYKGKEAELPQNACFGDDTPIDVSMLEEIRETIQKQAVIFPWQKGDVLMIDNMLVCHGRMPFKGPRSILVSMSY